ncbi:MAG TPA: hypothetical protein VHC44_16640 [Verrucomicrobiae bacterium]|nr:hypothetical protein [Verrucomicrobiae bacterium]
MKATSFHPKTPAERIHPVLRRVGELFASIFHQRKKATRPRFRMVSGSKARRIMRRQLAEKRENLQALKLVFLVALVPFAMLVFALILTFRSTSPRRLVEAQIVTNVKIANPNPAPKAVTSLSPFAAFSKVEGRNGEKYAMVSFEQLAGYPFAVTPEIADAKSDPARATSEISAQLPNEIKALDTQKVALTGFVLPTRLENGLARDFLLLRSRSGCCFGVMPKITEWVIVRVSGKGIKPVMDVPMTAFGTFHVGEQRDDGHLLGIYLLDCDRLTKSNE